MNKFQIDAIQDLANKLRRMIIDLKEYEGLDYYKDRNLKVRPGYGYDKFYLDWVSGSYDMSLHSLINFMLQDHKHYKKILSKKTYRNVTRFNKTNPEGLYDFGGDKNEQMLIDEVTWYIVCAVRISLEQEGFEYSSYKDFIENDYDAKSILPHISKYNLVDEVILDVYFFMEDLKVYLSNNSLSESDIGLLKKVTLNSGSEVEIAQEVHIDYPSLTKDLLDIAIGRCKKKSECAILSHQIKRLNNDANLLEKLNNHKQNV